ncbi:MAG: GNAT family N-acetyltransferase [Spirosomataceae bacterium]
MVVFLLQRAAIVDNQWNDFVAASPQAILYANTWYLDVVAPNWCALVMEEKGAWQAVMPLPIRTKWGIKVIQQPFFCQILGVFALDEATFEKATSLFQAQLPHYFNYISVYTGRFSEQATSFLDDYLTQCSTDVLVLNRPYHLMKANYSADRKKNLRRAEKFNWHIKTSTNIEPLIGLFHANHAQKIGVAESAYDLLRRVFQRLKDKNLVRLVYAIKAGEIEAGALFAVANQRIIYLFNAATPLGRQANGRTLLIDDMIQQYAQSGFIFDFESPEIASIKTFYQSFGTKKEGYQSLHLNNLPFPLKQIQEKRRRLT